MTIRYVNTGTSANKGDGDSLRSAFITINQNFSYLSTLTNTPSDLVLENQSIYGTMPNQNIEILPNGTGTVVVPSLGMPLLSVNTVTTSTVAHVGTIYFNQFLDASFAPGTYLSTGTYGIPYAIPAPYSVFSTVASDDTMSNMQVGDSISSADIKTYPVVGIGTGSDSNVIVLDLTTFQLTDEDVTPWQEMHVIRDMTRDFTSFVSEANTGIILDGAGTEIQCKGSLIPFSNDLFTESLGMPHRRWSDIWIGAGSVHILDETLNRDVKIGAASGKLTLGKSGIQINDISIYKNKLELENTSSFKFVYGTGDEIFSVVSSGISLGTGTSITFGDGTVQSTAGTGGAANTGDVTFDGVKIIGAGTASGDGNGYSTLELVPDNNLYNNNQYLVIDPTAPSHIHIRAGGTQDASTAELYLGGELNYVRARDGLGVRLNNAQFIPDSVYFAETTDYDTATWSTDESGNHWIDIRSSDPFNPTRDATPINTAGSRFSQYPTRNSIEVFTGSSLFIVSGNGQAYTLGNPYDYRIGTNEAPPANPTTIASMDYRLNTFEERYLYLENNQFETYADVTYVYSDQTIDLITGTGNIKVTTDDNNSSYSWYFTAQGYMQFPQGLGPTTSKGKEGDEAGSVVFDGSYIYYCHTDYTDGVADIWKRVQWSNDTW